MGKQNYLTEQMDEFFYLNIPIETEHGVIKPIKVKDYPFVLNALNIIQKEDFEWAKELRKYGIVTRNKEEYFAVAEELMTNGLIDSIHTNLCGLRKPYIDAFATFIEGFNQESMYKIRTYEQLDELVRLIYKVNGLTLKEKTNNDEMQKWLNLKKVYMSRKSGGKITFTTMCSSICKEFGYTPEELGNLTLYQFFEDFKRIEKFKNHDLSALFKTVDYKDKVKVQSWYSSGDEVPEEIEPIDPSRMEGIKLG